MHCAQYYVDRAGLVAAEFTKMQLDIFVEEIPGRDDNVTARLYGLPGKVTMRKLGSLAVSMPYHPNPS